MNEVSARLEAKKLHSHVYLMKESIKFREKIEPKLRKQLLAGFKKPRYIE